MLDLEVASFFCFGASGCSTTAVSVGTANKDALTLRAVTMSYGYASKFMPACKTVTATRKALRIGQAG
jgi:hypothetical protein